VWRTSRRFHRQQSCDCMAQYIISGCRAQLTRTARRGLPREALRNEVRQNVIKLIRSCTIIIQVRGSTLSFPTAQQCRGPIGLCGTGNPCGFSLDSRDILFKWWPEGLGNSITSWHEFTPCQVFCHNSGLVLAPSALSPPEAPHPIELCRD
jgi:hypothetical protein